MTLDPSVLALAVALALGVVVAGPVLRWWLRRRRHTALAADLARLRWPTRALAGAVVVRVLVSMVDGDAGDGTATALVVAAAAWVVLRLLWLGQEVVFRRLEIDTVDNLRARSRRTQIELLRRVAAVVIVSGAVVVTALSLTPLAAFGPSIVAYAGLIGVVLGLALRAPIENLAAGVVIAFSEPVRLDDVVVVEGEWGRIEQIGLVNVVVRLWDDRRLVLPTSRFVNEPFENWTRRSSHLVGAVTLWLDYTADLQELRGAARDLLVASPRWDRRTFELQVVELGERAVQVRVLVSARNAGELWDLRCDVREGLLEHLRRRAVELPRVRADGPGDLVGAG